MDDQADLERFLRARPRLFGLAYRVVGNVHEAEDVLQEVWVRWQRADRASVRNADAFLGTVTVRLAINLIQLAPGHPARRSLLRRPGRSACRS